LCSTQPSNQPHGLGTQGLLSPFLSTPRLSPSENTRLIGKKEPPPQKRRATPNKEEKAREPLRLKGHAILDLSQADDTNEDRMIVFNHPFCLFGLFLVF